MRWVVIGVIALTSGCAPGGGRYFGNSVPPDGQVLRYISGPEPESLDPQVSSGQTEGRIHVALFDGLTEYDPRTAAPIPSLAERWEITNHNTEFVFHLRTDARWSNSRAITAHDFVYTFRRGLSPEFAARAAYLAYDVLYAEAFNGEGVFVRHGATGAFVVDPENPSARLTLPGSAKARSRAIAADPELRAATDLQFVPVTADDLGVEAVDDHTLRIRTVRPTPYLLGLLAHQFFRAVPREAVERFGDDWTRPGHIVTSGAFLLESWKAYDRLVVVKNPRYWDRDRVTLDRITFYPIEDLTTMMNLYRAGEVDATFNHTVPAGWVEDMRRYPDYMDAPEASTVYYLVNTTRPPMNDVRVRKAFNAAIDKRALAALRRSAKPMTGVNPIGIFPGYPDVAGDGFDPARARALLAEAGFRNAAGDYDPARVPIDRIALMYNTASSNRQVAEFVQAQWKQNLGVTVPLRNMEARTQMVARNRLDYDGFARGGWAGDFLDPFTFLTVFATQGGDNGTGWSAPEFVRTLNEANSIEDPRARMAALARAESMVIAAQPIIPLYVGATNWLKKPYVNGLYPNALTMHPWKFVSIEHDHAKWETP
jgi:oligopeptide transport system substrate-binding protein